MVTLILILSIVMFLICLKTLINLGSFKYNKLILAVFGVGISGIASILIFIWFVYLIYSLGTAPAIEEKIKMYQEENTSIERRIDSIINNYMNFEKSTFIELKDQDAISLIYLFPELKSDDLVKNQISVYMKNNEIIKELKEKHIELSEVKWCIYFGR